jgi:hypothetical protein
MCLAVKPVGKPDAGNRLVRFDESKSASPRNTSTYSRTLDERRQCSPNRSNNGNSPRGVTRMTPITTMP